MIRRPPRSTLFPYNDALPICVGLEQQVAAAGQVEAEIDLLPRHKAGPLGDDAFWEEARHGEGDADQARSEEHTSELQSRQYLVCRLLLEKKQNSSTSIYNTTT